MGRPLNKKYFGNRNIGTTDATDSGIGGEGVASYTVGPASNYQVDTTHAAPTYAVKKSSIPGGVRATVVVHWEVASITVSNGLDGNGYDVTTGSANLATLTGLDGVKASVVSVGSGQGEIQSIDFSFAGSDRGDFTTIPATADSYQVNQVTSDGNQQVTVTWRVKSIEVTEKGSGYTKASDAALTFTGGTKSTAATATAVLTTDAGKVGTTGNQENAILATAQLAGGTNTTVDIISQKGAKRFKVTDGTRTGVCILTASAELEDGQMSIAATDANGNTYFVTKVSAHKATLTRDTQNGSNAWVYADDTVAPWRLIAAQGSYVQIANA